MLSPWRPTSLSRPQQEERRHQAQQLLERGEHATKDIAEALGVAESTVRVWKKKLKDHGSEALKASRSSGRPCALTSEQHEQLRQKLRQGALAHHFPDDRWTGKRVRELVGTSFNVWYHPDYVSTVLHQLGFSPQRPETRAMERKEEDIQTWMKVKLPQLGEKNRGGHDRRVL